MPLNNYLKQSKSPISSIIYVLPLFIIYELGLLFLSSDESPTVRNGADVFLRNMFENIGIPGLYGIGILLILGFLIVFFSNRDKLKDLRLNGNLFIFILFESLVWALILHLFLSQSQLFLLKEKSQHLVQQILLAVGSGIFEEFLFRVILIGILAAFISFFIKKNFWYKMSIAVFVSAAAFAYFHFIGINSEEMSLVPFMIRFLAGLYLGFIYVMRGFGVVAYTHSFYNLFIIAQL